MGFAFTRAFLLAVFFLPFGASATVGFAQSAGVYNTLTRLPVQNVRVSKFKGDVVFIRGGFGVFSRGLDAMAATLTKRGVNVRIVRNSEVTKTYRQIVNNQKRYGRKPVILVGHSWGANAAINIARHLAKNKIKVNYLATFAATDPSPIPRNVRKVTNYYFKTNGWGRPVKRGRGMRGRMKNIDLSTNRKIHHFNVEKNPKLQRQVLRNILRIIRPGKRA